MFLARLNALAVIPFIAFFSILSTGGDLATQQANLPTDFLLVLVGPDPALHDGHRVPRPAPGPGQRVPAGEPRGQPAPAPRAPEGPCITSSREVFWTSVVAGGLLAGVPLMFTALGETISERAGVLNIGLEGMMLVGAYVGFLGAYYGHSQWLGYLARGSAAASSGRS